MNSALEPCEKAFPGKAVDTFPQRLTQFTFFAVVLLTLAAANSVLDAFGNKQELDLLDPIFDIRFRHLLLIFGLTALCIMLLCLLKDRDVLCFAVLWFSAIFGIYRIGLWTMGWPHPYPFLAHLIETFHYSPIVGDLLQFGIVAFLLIGSSVTLWFQRRGREPHEFSKMPCPSCGGHIGFPAQHIGRQIPCPHCQKSVTLRKPEFLKMSCFFCKNRIEFPAHALSQMIRCPHCKQDVCLKEEF